MFEDLSLVDASSNQMTLSYTLSYGLVCLISVDTTTSAQICVHEQILGGDQQGCHDGEWVGGINGCGLVDLPHDYRSIGDTFNGTWSNDGRLRGDTLYSASPVVSYRGTYLCPDSSGVVIRTLIGVPTASPTSVTFTPGDLNFTLAWNPPPFLEQNGNISHYLVTMGDSEGGVVTTHVYDGVEYSGKYNSQLSYDYSVAACTSRGCGPGYNNSHAPGKDGESADSAKNGELNFGPPPSLPPFLSLHLPSCLQFW